MPRELDREGFFKVRPEYWSADTAASGAVQFGVRYLVLAKWDTDAWDDRWAGADVKCWGSHNIIKRDGSANETTCRQLAESWGWDGSEPPADWVPPECVIEASLDEYGGKRSFRANWVYPRDFVPGSRPTGSNDAQVSAVFDTHAAKLRAACSAAVSQQTTPADDASAVKKEDLPF